MLIHVDWSAGGTLQLDCAAHMVNVGMGNDDLLHGQLVPFQDSEDRVDVGAGIDDRSPQGSLIRENAAVAGEGADGKDLVNHLLLVRGALRGC